MSSRTIMLADDDVDFRESLRDALTLEGYDLVTTQDGSEALSYLRANVPPALILLDWNMAPMNGPQFMAEFEKDRTLSNVPVVLLTADHRAPEKAAQQTFSGYLRKPFSLDKLLDVLQRHCG